MVAFISGGYVAKSSTLVGQSLGGLLHVADWYATLAELVGQDPTDHKAAALGLPPIDSLSALDYLLGRNNTSPRTEVALSCAMDGTGFIYNSRYKLVRGKQGTSFFPGPTTPNSTNDGSDSAIDCGRGCLFDLDVDPVEHNVSVLCHLFVISLSSQKIYPHFSLPPPPSHIDPPSPPPPHPSSQPHPTPPPPPK